MLFRSVITRFPAEELMIAGREHYYTSRGQLPGVRETQSNLNRSQFADPVTSDGAPARAQ